MRQIGVRDEAGIIGGVASCGRALCCCTWLHAFAPINVRMAKTQRMSLNPVTISGMCGRLKCCLRYEYDCYREMGRDLPFDGSVVECPGGRGCVVDRNILARRLRVRLEDNRVQEYAAEQVACVRGAGPAEAAAREEKAEVPAGIEEDE
jgi:cell fate regulator YaaT (PSP1 superfamily)